MVLSVQGFSARIVWAIPPSALLGRCEMNVEFFFNQSPIANRQSLPLRRFGLTTGLWPITFNGSVLDEDISLYLHRQRLPESDG
ncbi:MAG: hypothetical protein ABSH48_07270 [Verrucomicrobiota bacterium]